MAQTINTNFGIGPMSSHIIEATFRFSHYHRKELMLIASKNQIDYSGGYVNGWTTKEYMSFVKEMRDKYNNSKVFVCRDHCGPGFNGNYQIKDVYETLQSDIENGFDLIHIDFCHHQKSKESQLEESKKAIEFCLKLNPNILLEIGTDENAGVAYNILNLEEIEREIDYFKSFCEPTFFVVQTGSLVKEVNQAGNFNKSFVERVAQLIHGKGMKLKEHNADYLSKEEISQRRGLVDALNVAPQFGVAQTGVTLTKCLTYGVKFDDFINEAYEGGKWKKWLHRNTSENKLLCAIIAGHYHFNSDSYKKIINQLESLEDIHENIINAAMDLISHYEC